MSNAHALIMKSILLNKNMMDTLKDKKYKITVLRHVNPNNTSVFAHYSGLIMLVSEVKKELKK